MVLNPSVCLFLTFAFTVLFDRYLHCHVTVWPHPHFHVGIWFIFSSFLCRHTCSCLYATLLIFTVDWLFSESRYCLIFIFTLMSSLSSKVCLFLSLSVLSSHHTSPWSFFCYYLDQTFIVIASNNSHWLWPLVVFFTFSRILLLVPFSFTNILAHRLRSYLHYYVSVGSHINPYCCLVLKLVSVLYLFLSLTL